MKQILIVDDEAAILGMLEEALGGDGFDVATARSASDALQLVKDRLFDAAIVDFALPDMNGVMLHSRIRQMDPELAERTIFISGRAQSEDDLSYYSSAAGGFLAKPFTVLDVLNSVHRLTD